MHILVVTGKCCTFVQSLTLSQNVVENKKQKTLKRKEVTHIDALSELKSIKAKALNLHLLEYTITSYDHISDLLRANY